MSIRNLQVSSKITNSVGNVQVQDVTDMLPKNPKNTWAQLAGVRPLEDLTTIILHHDAYPKANVTGYTDLQMMAKIANQHIANTLYDATGEGGIPYHIFIRNGRVYQCNDLLDRTYGVGSNNGYTVHIVVSGDYYKYDTLADGDRLALYSAILMVIDVLPNFKEIKAHKELNPTDCPGYDFVKVREDIKNLQMKMQQQDTWEAKHTKVQAMLNQFLYFSDLVEKGPDDGNAKWAMAQQMILHDVMKEKGYV